MNFSELLTHLDNLQKDSETLKDVVRLLGGKKEDVIQNLLEMIENKPLNRAQIIEAIDTARGRINDVESEFENVYSDISSAIDSLEYIGSELDGVYEARQSLDDLESDLNCHDEETEEPVKKTPAKKTTAKKDTYNTTTQQ
jgi:chromosome segregation ATPase